MEICRSKSVSSGSPAPHIIRPLKPALSQVGLFQELGGNSQGQDDTSLIRRNSISSGGSYTSAELHHFAKPTSTTEVKLSNSKTSLADSTTDYMSKFGCIIKIPSHDKDLELLIEMDPSLLDVHSGTLTMGIVKDLQEKAREMRQAGAKQDPKRVPTQNCTVFKLPDRDVVSSSDDQVAESKEGDTGVLTRPVSFQVGGRALGPKTRHGRKISKCEEEEQLMDVNIDLNFEAAKILTSPQPTRPSLRQKLHRRQLAEELRKERGLGSTSPGQILEHRLLDPMMSARDLPCHTIQDRPKLENPTRYHMLQSQRRQVQDYLESNLADLTERLPAQSSLPSHAGMSRPSPTSQQFSMSISDMITLSVSAPDAKAAPFGPVDNSVEMREMLHSFIDLDSNDSEDKDIHNSCPRPSVLFNMDSDKSGNQTNMSASCPTNFTEIKEEPISETDFKIFVKDRQKKDNHNMIERRRRFNINDRIKELGTLLPKNTERYYDLVRDLRQNKGTILRATVEYIRRLKRDQQRLLLIEERQRQSDSINKKLADRIQELELMAKAHGVPVSSPQWNQLTPPTMFNAMTLTERTAEKVKAEYDIPQSSECLNDLIEDEIMELSMPAPHQDSYDDHSNFGLLNGSSVANSPQSYDGGVPFSPDSVDMM